MVLVYGAEGIFTGWSTSIPNHNPRDVAAALQARIKGVPGGGPLPLTPWYRGHTGAMVGAPKQGDGSTPSFITSGKATVDAARTTITTTEPPVGKWTQDASTGWWRW